MANRVEQLESVQDEARDLFAKKNADYGDAFANYGPVGVLIRMGDKIARMQTITKSGVTLVSDETLRDSLIDLHNYAAMAVMLLDEKDNDSDEPPLHIDEEMLKDVLYGQTVGADPEGMHLEEISSYVYSIVCGERIDLETCKTLISAALDTYVEIDVASAYLAVALRLVHEGEDVLALDAALRAREPLVQESNQGSNNIMVAEAGVGIITDNPATYT